MKIIGTNLNGYIVELGKYEMEALTAFNIEYSGRVFSPGEKLDVHAAFHSLADAAKSARTLRHISKEMEKAANFIEKKAADAAPFMEAPDA